jgi:hypothetical protein
MHFVCQAVAEEASGVILAAFGIGAIGKIFRAVRRLTPRPTDAVSDRGG